MKFTTRCLVGGPDAPSIILIPEQPKSDEAEFEVLHELGHASPRALEAEVVALLDPAFVAGVALVALFAAGWSWPFAAWCSVWLWFRLFYWASARRTGIEAEVLADTFAYDVLENSDRTLNGALPYAQGWERNSRNAHSFAVRVQSRARLRCFNARFAGQRLPVGVVQYSPVGLVPTLGLVLGPILCPDQVWPAVVVCTGLIALELIVSFVALRQDAANKRSVR